ncbi:MAG: cupin domain-containing protein [Pseudomonadota bacterium]
MQIHADLGQRAVVDSTSLPWVESPLPGVERRMLERDGGEVARATSIVRYAPDSYFDAHTHSGGEEFLVLDGIFSDEMGDFPRGMYVRNPIGSRHRPFSKEGATILVKLRQFDPEDQAFVRIDTEATEWLPGSVQGLEVMPLHQYGSEHVALVKWQPGTRFVNHSHPGGEEIFVLSGTFADEQGSYPEGTWLRNPPWSVHSPFSEEGCIIFVKTGHLGDAAPKG